MKTRTHNAFTIIEVLVVIGIIGVLIAILLPTLAGARIAARETESLTNARTIFMSFNQYAEEQETYPFPGQVEEDTGNEDAWSFYWYPPVTIVASTNIWIMDRMWPAMLSEVAPWEEHFQFWVSPGADKDLPSHDDFGDGDGEPGWRIGYEYSNSFIGSPKLWSGDAAPDRALLQPSAPHQVQFPSSKVAIFDRDLAYRTKRPGVRHGHYDAPTPMAFVDGHAAVHNPLDAQEGTANPLNAGDTRTLHNTLNGINGVDF